MQTALLQKLQRVKTHKLGQLPVVILPLEDYEEIREDLEMLSSKQLARDIAKTRKEIAAGKGMTLAEVKKRLKI